MKYYKTTSYDIAENLEIEDNLIKNYKDDVFMIWRNSPSVVVGRNQCVNAEVDVSEANIHNIPIVRRNSGGGAVYHDSNVINFSFILKDDIDENKLLYKLISFLPPRNIKFNKNDVLVDGKKIIGTAKYYSNGCNLFHGSILYDADISIMERLLTPDPNKLKLNFVTSIRQRVGNIKEIYNLEFSTADFMCEIMSNLTEDKFTFVPSVNMENSKYKSKIWNLKY